MTVFEIAHYLLYGALHLLSVILFKCSQFSIQSVKCMRYIPSARRSEKKKIPQWNAVRVCFSTILRD